MWAAIVAPQAPLRAPETGFTGPGAKLTAGGGVRGMGRNTEPGPRGVTGPLGGHVAHQIRWGRVPCINPGGSAMAPVVNEASKATGVERRTTQFWAVGDDKIIEERPDGRYFITDCDYLDMAGLRRVHAVLGHVLNELSGQATVIDAEF